MSVLMRFFWLKILTLVFLLSVYSFAESVTAKHLTHFSTISHHKRTKTVMPKKLSTFFKLSPRQTMVEVDVDFSTNAPQKNLSGFLHGMSRTEPPERLLSPLKPAWWRMAANDPDVYARAVRLGAQPIIVVSDAYGYPCNNWQGHGPPWANEWSVWEATVRELAQRYGNVHLYWDIWNEPDEASWNKARFWNGTQAQYFEAYQRAYNILRQELGPTAIIGGPSFANYNKADLKAFLNFCNQNNLQVNFLSWHELSGVDFSIPAVAKHLLDMRRLVKTMPKLEVRKILVNESVGPRITYYPGDILGFLYYLEKGGADGANRACWDDSLRRSNCFNKSLDGLINPDTGNPRAAWWAYRTYADTLHSRVSAKSNKPQLVVLASKKPAQVLIGYIGQNSSAPAKVKVLLRNLDYFGKQVHRLRAKVFKVPNLGEADVTNLVPVGDWTVRVTRGSATIILPSVAVHEEYVLNLNPD